MPALIAAAVLLPVPEANAQQGSLIETCSSTGNTINIRSGPGTDYRIVGSLENATSLRVLRGDLSNPESWIEVQLLDDLQITYIGQDVNGYVLARLTTAGMCQVLHSPAEAGTPASRVAGRDITLGPWDPTHDLHLQNEGHPQSERPYRVGMREHAAYLAAEGLSADPYAEDTALTEAETAKAAASGAPAASTSVASLAAPRPVAALAQSGADPTKLRQQLARIELNHGIYALAISPDGRQLLTGEADGTARLYDSGSLQELRVFSGGSPYDYVQAVVAVAFSPDGSLVAAGDPDWTVRIYEVDGAVRHEMELDVAGRRAWGVAFSPDGRALASADTAGHLALWDVQTGGKLWQVVASAGEDPVRYATSVTFARDGATMFVGTGEGFVKVFETASGREVRRIEAKRRWRNVPVLSPDNSSLAILNSDGLRIVETQSTTLIKEITHRGGNSGVFTHDGKHLILGQTDSDAVGVVDVYGDRPSSVSDLNRNGDNLPGSSALSVVLAPDGSFVASASIKGSMIVLGPRP